MIFLNYSALERETTIITNDDRGTWKLETYQSKVVTKLRRAGVEPKTVREDGQHIFELDFNQVSFRSGKKRQISEEQKAKQAERMRNMHKSKKQPN